MPKERLLWRDSSGKHYYFDYEVDLDSLTENGKKPKHLTVTERLKRRLLQTTSHTLSILGKNGHKK